MAPPAICGLAKKYLKLGKGPTPFIDPGGCKSELDTQETAFRAVLDQQKKGRRSVAHRRTLR